MREACLYLRRSTLEWPTTCGENTARGNSRTPDSLSMNHGKRCISDCQRRGKWNSKDWPKALSQHIRTNPKVLCFSFWIAIKKTTKKKRNKNLNRAPYWSSYTLRHIQAGRWRWHLFTLLPSHQEMCEFSRKSTGLLFSSLHKVDAGRIHVNNFS